MERIRRKLLEEIELLTKNYFDIEENGRVGYFLDLNVLGIKAMVQLDRLPSGVTFTYSIVLKPLDMEKPDGALKLLTRNFELKRAYLWPMEINNEWYLIGSCKKQYESYLPGQLSSQLESLMRELHEAELN